jgi:hypothetical protein
LATPQKVVKPVYLNKQLYSECQLVTAINAAVFLGESSIERGCPEYERLVDAIGARDGSAVDIGRAHSHLGIKRKPLFHIDGISWEAIEEKLEECHPVELSVWHKTVGFHSVLVTNCQKYAVGPPEKSRIMKFCKVMNLPQLTRDCYITWQRLRPLLKRASFKGPVAWYFYRDYTRFEGRSYKGEDEPDAPYVWSLGGLSCCR